MELSELESLQLDGGWFLQVASHKIRNVAKKNTKLAHYKAQPAFPAFTPQKLPKSLFSSDILAGISSLLSSEISLHPWKISHFLLICVLPSVQREVHCEHVLKKYSTKMITTEIWTEFKLLTSGSLSHNMCTLHCILVHRLCTVCTNCTLSNIIYQEIEV